MTTIFVTGATGTIGSATLKALTDKPGVTVKAAVRKDSFGKLPQAKNIAPVDFDWAKPQAFADALKGVDAAFLITPVAEDSDTYAQAFIDAAKKAGVKHIVKLSSAGADAEPGIFLTRLHRKAERMLEASGLGHTHLRPAMFAENLVNYWPPQKDGNIYVPFGDGKVAYVSSEDVGAAAAAILLDPARHNGKAYLLTGSRAVGTDEAAALLAKATGRTIRYVDVPPEAARKSMIDAHTPAWMADGFIELFGLAKAGWLGAVTTDLETLIGRKPTSLESFVERRRAAWV